MHQTPEHRGSHRLPQQNHLSLPLLLLPSPGHLPSHRMVSVPLGISQSPSMSPALHPPRQNCEGVSADFTKLSLKAHAHVRRVHRDVYVAEVPLSCSWCSSPISTEERHTFLSLKSSVGHHPMKPPCTQRRGSLRGNPEAEPGALSTSVRAEMRAGLTGPQQICFCNLTAFRAQEQKGCHRDTHLFEFQK